MATITLKAGELAPAIRKSIASTVAAYKRGLRRAAERSKAHLVSRTPVDMGQLKSSWSVSEGLTGVALHNSSPIAGVIDLGARPHPVSKAGRQAITEWAARKVTNGDLVKAAGVAAAIIT